MHTETKEIEMKPALSRPFAFMKHVSRAHAKWLFGVLFAVFVAELAGTSIPYIFKIFIDTAGEIGRGEAVQTDIWLVVILFPLMTALTFVSWRVSGFIGMEWASRSNATSYKTLFGYLAHHSHAYFADRFAGSLSSKISHASEGVQSLFEAFMWSYVPSVLGLIFTVGYIWFSSATIALIFIGLIVLLVPLNIMLARARRPHVVEFSAQATRARGYAVDAISNMAAIRQYVRMDEEKRAFEAHIDEMRRLNIKQWRISEWGLLLNNAIIVLFEAAMLFASVTLWMSARITTGELIMIATLMMNVQSTLVFIGMSMNGFIRRYAEIEEGLTDIIVPHEILDTEGAVPLVVREGVIVCDRVHFAYGNEPVFKDFSLTIRSGERVGLVGTSGAGKTTLVSLLLRQHEVQKGSISIDGQNISMITQDSLRDHIAIVPQEPLLFHRSISENIAYGKPGATQEEIENAAEKAQAHTFISSITEGYNTLVGERGVKLSGGQKQRIAIARAILKNSPILILDEATSALDSESEVAIQKALQELMKGKTVIAIAHRLSTLREMDRIVVLENGAIIEDGTHDTLAAAGGTYARLWEHQAGGFLTE